MPITPLILVLAAAVSPTAADVEQYEHARVIDPYISSTPDGRLVAEFAPNVAVRNVACEATAKAKVYRCRFESQVSDWGRSDGAWTSRDVLLKRHWKGHWREAS